MYVRLLTNNFLSEKAVGKSESKDVHLAVLRVLPEVIRESVDADASSKSVIVYDPASGEKKMVSPTAVDGIESLGEVKTAEQTEAEINARMQDTIQRSKDWLEGNVANPVGMQIQLGDGRIATIEAMHEDGKSAIATLPDGTQFLVSKDVLQRIVNNGQYADYKARRDAEAGKREAEQSTESAPETATEGGQPLPEEASTKEEESREYAQGDVFDVVVDGQKMHAEIVSPKDADGKFVVNVDDGESMRTLYVTPEELAAMEYREEPSPKVEETRLASEGSSEKALERGEQPTEEHTPTALERIPRDEKGNAQFHDVDTETAWDGLVEMSGNEETAHKVAEASLANAEKRLKAAKAQKEKGETPEELLRSIKENEAAVAEAQRVVDAWKAIVGEKSRREEAAKAEAERKAAEERERAEAEEKARIEAEKKETERIAAEKAEEEARVEAERKAEDERKTEEEERKERDENGQPFVVSSDGTTTFGEITEDTGLTVAPIKLSEGVADEMGNGYGLRHIEARHGDQIRKAGFSSVEEFVKYVASNYDKHNIKIGKKRANGVETYLIQAEDEHSNVLYVELSKDGSYWNVNSGGIFRKGYAEKKKDVGQNTEHPTSATTLQDKSFVQTDKDNGSQSADTHSDKQHPSLDKGTTLPADQQTSDKENTKKVADSEGENTLKAKIEAASADVNTEPTEAQKEAGNYKKGHVQVGTFDITIEQPEGSIRRGTDADGKKWESKMHNTYGYFRGTEGVDGDHIDVFLSNDIDGWNGRKVFVVDQYNPDGTFDEHKVMLGFNDMDEAKSDYLANYEKGWENGRRIDVSATNLEDFEKWIDSSHRKTKPFSEYSSVNKGSEKAEKKQEKQSVFDKAKEIADKEEKKRKADKPKQEPLTEAERKDAEEVAGALGYRVEWVDTMEENGTIDADKKVIRIAKDAENPLVQVLGHEVAHGVKRMDGGKFKALQKAAMEVVGEKEWNERIEKKRKLNAYADGKLAEEVTCDIVGEALNDKDALKRLAESLRGEKGILARLRDAVAKMVEYFKNRGDKEGVRRMKAADKLLAEFESALKEGVAPEQVKPKGVDRSVRSSKEMDEERLEIERKAKSDGTWLKAPNGKRTNLNERQWVDVRTKNFKEWFGDWENDPENASKIVDENGEPLMVFHYTWEDFTIFGEGKEIGASTFYNASDANYAATAAIGDWFTSESDLSDDMGKPMKVFLNIKNPSDGYSLEVLADEVGTEIRAKDYEAFDEDRDNTAPIIEAGKNYQEKLINKGYDGIFIADEEFGGTSYITFAPNQIKSAVENDGSYSPKKNDIRRSVREGRSEKTELTAEERELRDNLVKRMRKGGLDVVTDSEEMQRVIDRLNERTRNMFVGEKGATEADKAEEVSTRLDNLSVARRMEEAKKDAKTIKMATGWERGSDGKWRYETGDAKIKDTIELDGKTFKRYDEDMLWTSGKFGDVVDAPELFKAYPELRDVRIETDAVLNDMPSNGEYNPRTNTITIHSDDLKYQNSILNHEIQHAIQHIEGFETGGSAENVRERIQQVIDNSSDEVGYARERLREWADLNAMAAMLDVAYRKFVGSGNEWERAKAVEIYWDAINTIEDNDKAELAINYPHDKTPREIAESGYLVDDVIRELNRLADETRKEIPDGNIDTMRKVDRLVGALKDKTDFELYNRLAGEVEARNTEKRIGMTEEERRASLASETEDVAREDQILLGVDNADGEMNTGSVREHRVYHGSGADFDAFDHSHMGEGEGAQAYGWGTYVTEVEGIGRTYAIQNTTKHNDALRALQHDVDAISDQLNRQRDDLKYDEEQLKRANEWRAEAELDYELFKDEAEELKEKYGESSPKYRNHLFNDIYTDEMKRAQSSVKSTEESIQYRKEKIAELEKALKDKQAEIDELPKEFPRHLYTVEIPDDNGSNYLDWNEHPAESLLKDVGSFLEGEGFERVQDNPARYEKGESTVVLNPNATGADLYAELREALGSDKKASQALAELGCIGIKYPADNMRGGRKDGAKNYVIFNENDAKITDHTRFLRTADGEVYGLVKDGRIYLDPKVATAETAVHEYTHLWGDMLRRKDSEQWSHTVKELKNSVLWEEVKELYPELKTDDEIADEVLSTFSGRRGAERLREEARRVADGEGGVFTKAKAIETLERVKEAIARFWEGVARMFGINRYRSAEELADMAMRDLINGVKPTSRTFTFDNFYKDTKAVFEGTERPKGKPDYTSYSGSEYWYGEDKGGKYVVRGSDHWSGEFKVKDGERTNVGRNHYSEITEDGMLPIGAQGSLKFGWEKGLSKPVGSGISAAIDRRGSGDSNNIASCYWYIDNAKEKDNKGFTYGKAYLSEFEDKERRRDIPGDDWRDIQGLEGGTRAMRSDEIDRKYPDWLDGTTTDSGRHSTQVEGTRRTYNKVGDWIEKNIGKDAKILDASSGLGYGTADLKKRGFNIEDVEPYQSEERKKNNPATYSSYDDIPKDYDVIISNAVLNVIPDNWRSDVLHNMADHLKPGGIMFINTRKAGEERSIKDKIELDSPQEVLVKRNGKIASYQRFFAPKELKEWVEKELGNGYEVETANDNNSGTKGLAAVVVKKSDADIDRSVREFSPMELSNEDKQRRGDALRKAEPIDVKIKQIVKTKDMSARKAAEKWWKDNVGTSRFYDTEIGLVEINRASVGSSLAHRYSQAKLDAITSLVDGFNNAVYLGSMQDFSRQEGVKNHYFAYPINYNGYRNYVFCRAMQDANKNRLYVHEVFLADNIEKGNTLQTAAFQPHGGITLYKDILANVLTANIGNNSEPSKPRYSRKPGESIFDYASRVSEDVDRSVRERVSARDEYEKKVKSKGFQTKEALQSSMLGLQEFMLAIDHASGNKRYIEDIPDFENPILGENRLSSVNKEEMHQVAKTQFKPLMSAVAKLSGNGKESGELYDYMFAKHGLERDAVMRQREAQKEFDKYQKANPKGTKTIGDFVASLEGKDYAGLTALTAEDGRVKSIQSQIDTIDEQMKATDDQLLLRKLGGQKKRLKVDLLNAARDAADDIRKAFESNPSHDRSDINELWSRVNEVNGNTLRKLYESGMLTKEAYNDISSMYTNYIPMRGFDQTTSADAYAYLTHGDSAFNAPIKTAKGRSSKADNPIAYMQAMAESAIMQGNRNVLVKQKMLNFVRNHPSDLASVSDVWLQYDSVADEWKPFYAFGRELKGGGETTRTWRHIR